MEINKMLEGQNVSETLRSFLVRQAESGKGISFLKIITPDVAVIKSSRSEWGGSGGIGYFDQVRAYFHGQTAMQEWQWRDRYSERNDRHDLCVQGFGDVTITEEDDRVSVKVVLENRSYRNRTASFYFKRVKQSAEAVLSKKQQKAFSAKFNQAKEEVLADLERLYKCKPQMLANYAGVHSIPFGSPAYVAYQVPRIKQEEVRPEFGIGAFVSIEQIDHHGKDPQLRYELYVVDKSSSRVLLEDHSYEKEEGSALIAIIDLSRNEIVVNTRGGKRALKIK
jgi:hypothetical protein